MVALITDPALEDRLIAERRAVGTDRYDEVWEGVYVMAPMANNEHQDLVGGITTVLRIAIEWPGLGKVLPGVNVSDRKQDWEHNYRCPDVAVFLRETPAEDCGTHWFGGPDFGVEIASPNDRTLKKLPFYEKVGTSELLVLDRDPWALILYRLREGRLAEAGRSTPDNSDTISSQILPVAWRLLPASPRPGLEIVHHDGNQRWVV